jgi:ADP-ribose pyrophosphatase YjhB (NUDIX family)
MTFRDKSQDYAHEISFTKKLPHDDSFERDICNTCGLINYQNPKIIVGVVATLEEDGVEKILMCRRAIEPRKGFWTLPAGFMEERETTAQGAAREAYEEAFAHVETNALIGIYNVERISQVQMFYRAKLTSPDIAAGPESEEVALMAWDDIPWDELAFPAVYYALQHWHETRDLDNFVPFSEPENWADTPGFEALRARYEDAAKKDG